MNIEIEENNKKNNNNDKSIITQKKYLNLIRINDFRDISSIFKNSQYAFSRDKIESNNESLIKSINKSLIKSMNGSRNNKIQVILALKPIQALPNEKLVKEGEYIEEIFFVNEEFCLWKFHYRLF